MMRNKKGVSPVIAVVLMIVVAVAISLVVYVWASGFVSEKTGAETKAGDYSFLVETRAADNTNIRNTGLTVSLPGTTVANFLTEFDVYINNDLKDSTELAGMGISLQNSGTDTDWDKGEVLTIDFSTITGMTPPSAGDKIKLVHKESGTPIVFKLE